MLNPFTPGKPVSPEHFVGRRYEIASACAQIASRGHVAVWGGSGIGKRSFLEKLASPQTMAEHGLDPSEAVIVLLSCESISPFTPDGFWQEVLKQMQNKFDSESEMQIKIQTMLQAGQVSKDSLSQMLRGLKRQNKFLLLLVDDFDVALCLHEDYTETNRAQFLSECRSLAVHSQENTHLSMIVTSRKRLNELAPTINSNGSPWYNHYLFQPLGLFTEQEVDELLAPLTTQMTPELREGISRIAGRHPALLQIAGFILYNIFYN